MHRETKSKHQKSALRVRFSNSLPEQSDIIVFAIVTHIFGGEQNVRIRPIEVILTFRSLVTFTIDINLHLHGSQIWICRCPLLIAALVGHINVCYKVEFTQVWTEVHLQLINNSTLVLIIRADYYANSLDLEYFSLTTIFSIKTSYSQLKLSKNNSLINLL